MMLDELICVLYRKKFLKMKRLILWKKILKNEPLFYRKKFRKRNPLFLQKNFKKGIPYFCESIYNLNFHTPLCQPVDFQCNGNYIESNPVEFLKMVQLVSNLCP